MRDSKNRELYEIVDRILDLYLDGGLPSSVDRKIQAWLTSGQNRAEKEQALMHQWTLRVRESRPDSETYRALAEIRRRLGFASRSATPVRRSSWRELSRVAAVIVLALAAGGSLFYVSQNYLPHRGLLVAQQTVTVDAGEQRSVHVALPDGSQAWVKRHGSISYPQDFGRGRNVSINGEAYFSVVGQDGEPFTVESGELSVRVLGTEFSVKAGDEESQSTVEVAEGSVEVAIGGGKHLLGANDRLIYDKLSGLFTLGRTAPDKDVAAWKAAEMDFEACSLDEIFRRIETSYGVDITVDAGVPVDQRITAGFSGEDELDDVLDVLRATSGGFDFATDGDNVTITAR